MSKYIKIIVLSIYCSFYTHAQTGNIDDFSSFIFTCDATIYDDGGPNGDYSETDYTTTICSDNGDQLLFIVNMLSLGTSPDGLTVDEFIIYEGFGIGGTVLFDSNIDIAGTNLSSPSDCITVTFRTALTIPDITNVGAGFELRIDTQQCIDDAIAFLCFDGILNNGEALIDCGGPNCEPCASPTICGPNVIDNGDFELFDTAICAAGPNMGFGTLNEYRQLWINQSPVQGWYGLADYNDSAPNVTPDYHNEASCDWTIEPHPDFTGSSLGIITRPSNIHNSSYSEYVQTQLNTPLEAGEEYCVTLRAAVKNNGMNDTTSLEFWFHNNTYANGTGFISYQNDNGGEIILDSNSLIAPTPQIVEAINSPVITTESQHITYSFCAEGGEEYLVIGNFDPFPIDFHGTYVNIDDLVVAKSCPVDFDLSIQGPGNCSDTCFDLTVVTDNRSGGCEITNDFTFQWFVNGNIINGATTRTINVCPTLGDAYSVEVTYTAGCRSTTKTTAYESIIVTAGNDGNITICDNDTVVNLSDLITDEDPGGTWTRTSGTGGVFDFNLGVFTATSGATTSTFEYMVIAGDCNDVSEATVNIDAAPVAGNDGDMTLCNDTPSSIDLFSLITGEDPGGVWTRLSGTGGVFDATLGLFTSDFNTTTSVFEYTVTNNNNCLTDTSLVNITIENGLTAGIGSTITICDSNTNEINLFDVLTGGDSGGVWTRLSGTGGIFNATSGTFASAAGATNSTFEYTITNGNSCPDSSATVTINIDAALSAGIDGVLNICSTDNGTIDLSTVITGEDPGGVWIQTSGTGGVFDAVTGSFTIDSSTTSSTFEYTITNGNSCPDSTATATITIENALSAGTDGSLTICNIDTEAIDLFDVLTGEDPGGIWTQVSGFGGIFDPMAGTFIPTEGATSSTFEYTIANGNSCPDGSAMATIIIDAGNTAGTGGSIDICDNHGSIDLFEVITGEDSGGVWTQILGSGGVFDAGLGTFDPLGASLENRFLYTVPAIGSCPSESAEAVVNVYQEPQVGVLPDVTACDIYTLPILDIGGYFDGPQGSGNSYESGSQINTSMTMYVFAETPGCYVETTFTITIEGSPQVNIPPDMVICSDDTIDLTENEYAIAEGETGLLFTYYNNENDALENTGSLTNVSSYNPTSISETIWVRIESMDTGCFSIVSYGVITAALPTTFNAEVTSVSFADRGTIAATTTGVGSYEFRLDDGPYQDSNVFDNVQPGAHTITVRNALDPSCGVLSIEVCVLGYPKFFTPNDDGQNDIWIVNNLNCFQINDIKIFDRYGKLLKILTNGTFGWDGTYKGKRMPTSDYWFTINYVENGTQKKFVSHFTLKR